MYDIESAAKALRQLKAFEKQREKARQKVLESFNARWQAKHEKVMRALDEETRDAVMANLAHDEPAPGDFGQDPEDSARLLAIYSAIDDYLGWRNEEEQEAGDYLARIRQVAEELGKPPPESGDLPAWAHEQPEPAPKPQVIDRGGKGKR